MVPQFPGCYAAMDDEADKAQKAFFRATSVRLGLLAVAALGGVVALWARWASTVSALVLGLAVALNIVLRLRRPDDRWFKARAFAENVKSATWRYIMRGAPADDLERRTADEQFHEEIKQIRRRLPGLEATFSEGGVGAPVITPWMRDLRSAACERKAAEFKSSRLDDQIKWYSSHARQNKNHENTWHMISITIELLAFAVAATHAVAAWTYSPEGVLVTASAGVVAWMQSKRFSDLANSYGVAAADLLLLREEFEHVRSLAEFAELVDRVELAISREHRLWCDRRRT